MGYFFPIGKYAYVTGKKPDKCVLCLLREGSSELPDLSIFHTVKFHVTLNLYPYNPAHVMIYPARHIRDVRGYTAEEAAELERLIRYLLDIIDGEYHPAGYNIGYNMGLEAGASIEHLHLHIIPRYPNEIGIADLIGGARVIVEEPKTTHARLLSAVKNHPFKAAKD